MDVDPPLIPILAQHYHIDWHIYVSPKSIYFPYDKVLESTRDIKSANIHIYRAQHRYRSLKAIKKYIEYANIIRQGKYDIVYSDMLGEPYMFFIFKLFRIKNIIYACHDFIEHLNFHNGRLLSFYKKFIFRSFFNFQFFSQTQHQYFLKKYSGKKSFMAPLCLKHFGKSTLKPPTDKVAFTFFGHIRDNKGLHLLIEASNILADKGIPNFIINIYGHSDEWDTKYAPCIKHPEIFNLNIRHASNDEIPDIMSSSHYLVLPYLDVTQSGPLLIAYNYGIPAIASFHDGFKEVISDGHTGFLFRNADAHNLAEVMLKAITNHNRYPILKLRLSEYINRHLSTIQIANRYHSFFTSLTTPQQ